MDLNTGFGIQAIQILESITDAFFALDKEWKFIYLNRQAEPLLRRKREELLGKSVWDEFKEAVDSTFYHMYHKAVRTGKAVHFEEFYPPLNTWFEVRAYPFEQGLSVYFNNINERKYQEKVRKEAADKVKNVLDSIPELAWTSTADGLLDYYNTAWYLYTGVSFEELKGEGWSSVIHPEDLEPAKALWQKCLITGNMFERENRFRRGSDGTYRWFLVRGAPVRKSDGEIIQWVGTCTDIHEKKESEERFRFLAEFVPQIFWTSDPTGKTDYFNSKWYEYTGLSFEESNGNGWQKIFHPDDVERTWSLWQECLKTGKPYQNEYRYRRASDGQYRWHLGRAVPLRDKEGRIIKWFGTSTDIHDFKETQEEIKKKNRILEILNRLGSTISAELDLGKVVQTVTDAATELTGAQFGAFFYNVVNKKGEAYMLYTLSGVPKDAFSQFPHPRNTKVFDPTFKGEGVVRSPDITKDPRFGQNPPYHGMPEGHLPVRSYLAIPVASRTGEVLGGLFFGHSEVGVFDSFSEDIVKGIAAQAAIAIDNSKLFQSAQDKNQELLRINTDLDNFVYTASHDLKAPVSNIEGLMSTLHETLIEQTKDSEELNQLISMINLSIKRFKKTIADLTDISKIQKNLDYNEEEVNFTAVLEEVKLTIDDLVKKNNAVIEQSLEDCPGIRFSKVNVKSIFYNLLSNAIKYRHPDRRPHILLSCKNAGTQVVITVKDNGLGISERNREKLFGMFKRFHTHVEGSGIGLYIIKRMIENAGGRIEVESEEGAGTTFTVYLPVAL